MLQLIRPLIARLAGAAAAFLVAYLTKAFGPDFFGADFVAHLQEVIIGLALGTYALAHRALQRWIDPSDSAKPRPAGS